MKTKLYHFYFDEGGIFGYGSALIANKPLRVSRNIEHISNYHLGKMSRTSIDLFLSRFKASFPGCPVNLTERITIDCKERRKFPREMLVSDDEKSWSRVEVCGKVVGRYPYVTVTEMDADSFVGWKYAKEIE